jgi:SPP1 family predicted phage head-tail adaptor
MAYTAGELRERVTIRRTTETPNEYGTLVPADTDIATVWALVRPMSGGERDASRQVEASADYLIVMRYRADVRATDTLIWRGYAFNIRFIKDRGPRSLYLEIEAERGVAT